MSIFTFVMSGIVNQTIAFGTPWQLSIYDNSNNLISSSVSLNSFVAACGTICKTCTNSSYCLSCYNNTSINLLHYLDKTTNLCVSTCLSNQF